MYLSICLHICTSTLHLVVPVHFSIYPSLDTQIARKHCEFHHLTRRLHEQSASRKPNSTLSSQMARQGPNFHQLLPAPSESRLKREIEKKRDTTNSCQKADRVLRQARYVSINVSIYPSSYLSIYLFLSLARKEHFAQTLAAKTSNLCCAKVYL